MSPRGTLARDWTVPKQMHDCSSRATGPWGPRKESASIMAVISKVMLVGVLAPAYSRCDSVVMTGPYIISILPWGDRATAPHPTEVSPSERRVPPSV